MEELNKWIESELSGLKLKKADWGHLTIEDDSRERTLIDVQQQLKILNIPVVSNNEVDVCVIHGCDNVVYKRGACREHYLKLYNEVSVCDCAIPTRDADNECCTICGKLLYDESQTDC